MKIPVSKFDWIKNSKSLLPKGDWFVEFFTPGELHAHKAVKVLRTSKTFFQSATLIRTHTFGKVLVSPNGANAIPSQIRAWLDARAADEATLTALVEAISAEAHRHATLDSVGLQVVAESITPIVEFPEGPRARLTKALGRLGEIPVLPTAAGHDAGILSAQVPTAMLFVRNPTGISHSPAEHAEMDDCNEGAEALADVMADWISS